jgi:hypothetical protein
MLTSNTTQSMKTTSSVAGSDTIKGFAVYENLAIRASIQYPSEWVKHEIQSTALNLVVMFFAPTKPIFSSKVDSKIMLQKIKDMVYNECSTSVVVSIKKDIPIQDTFDILQDITNYELRLLDICFDEVNLLEKSYDNKMGKFQGSKLVYNYADPLENYMYKKEMKIISAQNHEIVITYCTGNQDFDKYLPTVEMMVGTFRIME